MTTTTRIDLDLHKFIKEVFDVFGITDQTVACRVRYYATDSDMWAWPRNPEQFQRFSITDPLKFIVNPWKVSGVTYDCAPEHLVILSFSGTPFSVSVYNQDGNGTIEQGRCYVDPHYRDFAHTWQARRKTWTGSMGNNQPAILRSAEATWLGTPVSQWMEYQVA
jgi:hypothetical protein